MARSFVRASSQYLTVATPVVLTPPFTMSCWFNTADSISGADQGLMCIYNSTVNNRSRHYLWINQGLTGGHVICSSTSSTGTTSNSTASGVIQDGRWETAVGVWNTDSNRQGWHNGLSGTADGGTRIPTGLDSTGIGGVLDSSPNQFFGGGIMEAAIWNVALTSAEINMLGNNIGGTIIGVSPLRVRPQSIVAYWPLWGRTSPEINLRNSVYNLSLINGPTAQSHGPVAYLDAIADPGYGSGADVSIETADLTLAGQDVALSVVGSVTIILDISQALSLSSGGDLEFVESVPVEQADLTLTGEDITVGVAATLLIEAGALTLTPEDVPVAGPTVLSIEPAFLRLLAEEVTDIECLCLNVSDEFNFGAQTQIVDIITEAYERCGIDGPGISGTMLDSARRSLEYMAADWANNGPDLFSVYLYTITLVPGQQSYTLPANTIYVVNAATRQTIGSTVTDLMIGPISRSEYLALPQKSQVSARPTQFYLERSTVPVIYPWPVLQPNSACQLLVYLLRMQADYTKFCGSIDGPQRAMNAIASGLASRLATKYAWDRREALKQEANEAYGLMIGEDRERVPYRITIDNPWGP